MFRRLSFLTFVGIILCSAQVAANPRTALVVGNSEYQHFPSLANPVNDAHDVSHALVDIGFDVRLLLDADLEQMVGAVRRFGELLADQGGLGLF